MQLAKTWKLGKDITNKRKRQNNYFVTHKGNLHMALVCESRAIDSFSQIYSDFKNKINLIFIKLYNLNKCVEGLAKLMLLAEGRKGGRLPVLGKPQNAPLIGPGMDT